MTDNPLRLFLDEESGARDKACKARKNSMPFLLVLGMSLILSCEVGGGLQGATMPPVASTTN